MLMWVVRLVWVYWVTPSPFDGGGDLWYFVATKWFRLPDMPAADAKFPFS
jgi:hypothetical protein